MLRNFLIVLPVPDPQYRTNHPNALNEPNKSGIAEKGICQESRFDPLSLSLQVNNVALTPCFFKTSPLFFASLEDDR